MGEIETFQSQISVFDFLGIKTVVTCRKYASELGQSLEKEMMKIVYQI